MPSEHSRKRRQVLSIRDCIMLGIGAAAVLCGMVTGNVISARKLPLKPEASTITAAWIPGTVKQYEPIIDEMAKKYKLDPNLIAIIITMESGGYAKAQSEAGAQGLMQITPPTAKDIAAKFLKQPRTQYDLFDSKTNIEFGTAYLSYLRNEFGSPKQGPDWTATVELVAAGYNGGPGAANNLEQGKGLVDTQPVIYSRDAFNMWRERHSSKSPTFDRWVERGGSDLLAAAKAAKQ
jgi:soluble lytic murein transglycosylase-like protein